MSKGEMSQEYLLKLINTPQLQTANNFYNLCKMLNLTKEETIEIMSEKDETDVFSIESLNKVLSSENQDQSIHKLTTDHDNNKLSKLVNLKESKTKPLKKLFFNKKITKIKKGEKNVNNYRGMTCIIIKSLSLHVETITISHQVNT